MNVSPDARAKNNRSTKGAICGAISGAIRANKLQAASIKDEVSGESMLLAFMVVVSIVSCGNVTIAYVHHNKKSLHRQF